MNQRKCKLCGNSKYEIYMNDVRDYEYGIPGKWDVLKCRNCGLFRIEPFPSLEEALATYPSSYVQYAPRKNPMIRIMYKRFVENQGKIMRAIVGENARVLDVGAGCGEFMKVLKEQNPKWNITGLEPSLVAVNRAKEIFKLEMIHGTLDTADIKSNSFDLVIMTHVIEHVPEPAETLTQVQQILKPSGVLYGETENIQTLDARLMGRYWGLFHIPRHLHFFTKETIVNCTQKAGFSDVQVYNTFNPGSWALGLQFYIEHQLKKQPSYGRTGYYPLLLLAAIPMAIIANLFSKDYSPAIRFICRK